MSTLLFTRNESPTIGVEVELQLVATVGGGNNVAPNFGAHSGDPRFLYIGQQNGVIRILDFNQPSPLLGTSFLNIASVLGTTFTNVATGERGLLGGAFHPDFNIPDASGFRKFYTYTSESIPAPNVVSADFTHPEIGAGGNHQSVVREWTVGDPDPGVRHFEGPLPPVDLERGTQVLGCKDQKPCAHDTYEDYHHQRQAQRHRFDTHVRKPGVNHLLLQCVRADVHRSGYPRCGCIP
jgi:hypothetical protein